MSNDPFDEGQLAASQGEPLSANPYPEDTEDHMEWAEGHAYVTGSDEDGNPTED